MTEEDWVALGLPFNDEVDCSKFHYFCIGGYHAFRVRHPRTLVGVWNQVPMQNNEDFIKACSTQEEAEALALTLTLANPR